MEKSNYGLSSIWFFVGWILFLIGIIVLTAGVYGMFSANDPRISLSNLHANLWWGGIIMIVGLIYIIKNRIKNK